MQNILLKISKIIPKHLNYLIANLAFFLTVNHLIKSNKSRNLIGGRYNLILLRNIASKQYFQHIFSYLLYLERLLQCCGFAVHVCVKNLETKNMDMLVLIVSQWLLEVRFEMYLVKTNTYLYSFSSSDM